VRRPRTRRARRTAGDDAAQAAAETAAAAAGAAIDTDRPADDGINDPPPAPSRRRRGRPPGSSNRSNKTREIEQALSKILVLPAMPFAWTGDPWVSRHFEERAPVLAQELAKKSETSPALRRQLEWLTKGDTDLSLVMAGVLYLVPPLMYFGIIPAPGAARTLLDVPFREEVKEPGVFDMLQDMGQPGPEFVPLTSGDGPFTHPPDLDPSAHQV
jgi:hypothetical protein